MDLPTIPSLVTNPGLSTPTRLRRSSSHISRKTSWGTPILPPSGENTALDEASFLDVDLDANVGGSAANSDCGEIWNTLDNIAALGLSFNAETTQPEETPITHRFSLDDAEHFANHSLPLDSEIPGLPFNKWVKTIQRRAGHRRNTVSCETTDTVLKRDYVDSPVTQRKFDHKKSSSGSSFGFVTAVKSASISLASLSIAPRSRRTAVSSRHHKTDRSNNTSHAGRLSEDSGYHARGAVIDQAVTNRLLQRRRVLEEIISSEESYLADVKFLMNVCVFHSFLPSLKAKPVLTHYRSMSLFWHLFPVCH